METSPDHTPLVDEEVWQEWVQKCKLREEATARKSKTLAKIASALFVVGAIFYLLVMKL
jgi:hypothetical protein